MKPCKYGYYYYIYKLEYGATIYTIKLFDFMEKL